MTFRAEGRPLGKNWRFWALAEAYALLRREHTNVACEWRIAREVDWKALSYSPPPEATHL